MKIGLVCPYNFFRHGAVQKLVMVLEAELTARGHDVRIITPRPYGYEGKVPKHMLFIGQSAKWNTPLKTTLEIGITLERSVLEDMLEAEDFDLLHVHEPEVPVLGAQIAARADCPIVATFHATMPDTAMSKSIELFRIPYARSIFKNIAAMTAVSETAARFVREWSAQSVDIVPNYVDLPYYSTAPAGVKRTSNEILYIGRLEKRKGVRYLIKAFAELAQIDQDIKLTIAGDGPEREKLEQWVAEHQVPRISFLGAVTEKRKLQLLHRAALFCSPAIYGESFGIVLLEAMAAGLPVIAGDNPGYACVMKDRGALSLVDPKDTDELVRRLELMLYDEQMRKLWLTWAKNEIKQYNFKHVIDQYEAVYRKAALIKSTR
jgi:phosphatidylinositol alpha-mannosyltransferase